MTRRDAGMTLLEVTVAVMLMSISVVPLLVSMGGARKRVYDSQIKRTMKQLLEYKMADMLLDRPEEGDDPIWIDGFEANFGESFENDPDKEAWFEEKYFNYSYRIDTEEVDLGISGGITGEEDEFAEAAEPPPETASGNPFGAGGGTMGLAAEEEEDLGQIRYRVTLTVFYHPGNASFNRSMSLVTYLRDPHTPETMTGPNADGGMSGGTGIEGLGEASIGGSATNAGGSPRTIGGSGGNRGGASSPFKGSSIGGGRK